jgi:hypothetical protein
MWKVMSLIAIVVTGFFNLSNPSSRTMALGFTQPLKEMNTRNLPGHEGWLAHKADITAVSRLSRKCGSLNIETLFAFKAYKKNSMVWVREQTIPTERPPLVGEVIANLCG